MSVVFGIGLGLIGVGVLAWVFWLAVLRVGDNISRDATHDLTNRDP